MQTRYLIALLVYTCASCTPTSNSSEFGVGLHEVYTALVVTLLQVCSKLCIVPGFGLECTHNEYINIR